MKMFGIAIFAVRLMVPLEARWGTLWLLVWISKDKLLRPFICFSVCLCLWVYQW